MKILASELGFSFASRVNQKKEKKKYTQKKMSKNEKVPPVHRLQRVSPPRSASQSQV